MSITTVVRFFIYDENGGAGEDGAPDVVECNENAFLECSYPIEYERNTIRENGVNQICLTKIPKF